MDEKVKIVFDKEYKIRALDPEKFERGEALEKECANFVDKISSFNEKVNTLVDVLDLHASRIDSQKLRVSCLRPCGLRGYLFNLFPFGLNGCTFLCLFWFKAIGLRVATESEAEQRIRQERALQTMINEKKAELDRWVTFFLLFSCSSYHFLLTDRPC